MQWEQHTLPNDQQLLPSEFSTLRCVFFPHLNGYYFHTFMGLIFVALEWWRPKCCHSLWTYSTQRNPLEAFDSWIRQLGLKLAGMWPLEVSTPVYKGSPPSPRWGPRLYLIMPNCSALYFTEYYPTTHSSNEGAVNSNKVCRLLNVSTRIGKYKRQPNLIETCLRLLENLCKFLGTSFWNLFLGWGLDMWVRGLNDIGRI